MQTLWNFEINIQLHVEKYSSSDINASITKINFFW